MFPIPIPDITTLPSSLSSSVLMHELIVKPSQSQRLLGPSTASHVVRGAVEVDGPVEGRGREPFEFLGGISCLSRIVTLGVGLREEVGCGTSFLFDCFM